MTQTTLLGNGVVLTGAVSDAAPQGEVIVNGAVVWTDDRIVAVGAEPDLRRQYPKARYVDAHGGMILPGLVNLHHHFYSALARGLDPRIEIGNFGEVLDRLWWRLDRALDPDTVRLSAALSLAACVREGCTTVFDHHASPNCIDGSLDLIAEEVERCGLSAALCYEVTDRNGHDGALAGLAENLRFLAEHKNHARVRGIVGLHASFTLRDQTLELVARDRPEGAGCHIHVAEDPIDVIWSNEQFGTGPVDRLTAFGLLDESSLLAHGIHLERPSYEVIAAHDAVIVHNPESNAHNGVGHLDVAGARRYGCLVGLGTDGMSSSVLRALRAAFLLQRHERRDPSGGFSAVPGLLAANARVARRFFDEPLLGVLAPEAPADVIVVDAPPPSPLDERNAFAHLVYGASDAPVRHTVARGRVLLQDFAHTAVDVAEIAAKARRLTPPLWGRFHALPWGTRFLGA
ncbi:MAG: amidohydrolase family protein [Gemmatimonadota bacterium]|nr:amidohydrolase family protein [Gemmatimonadota bacterium]MDH3368957.1 amidohydrolase family protein [Gemmatimonadota bacterium]MDH3479651.1 amidohydrolase family protein [Gemmatimonadota bacterium]MDH3570755.1 amidohydrolase family protein [Gemmatimonadota bacterium]MDH5548906.1 amidohydrolase family protein [Gemmatimonadota bacterium]